MDLYHLDRRRSFPVGSTISHLPAEDIPQALRDTIFYKQFPNGLSSHGLSYLSLTCPTYPFYFLGNEPCYPMRSVSEQIEKSNSLILEFAVELVRKSYFPQYPSRYESLFSVGNLDDFRLWPELCRPEDLAKSRIIKIDAPDDTHCFDAAWLRGGLIHNIDGNRYYISYAPAYCFDLAFKYWSKESSEKPRWEYLIPLPIDASRISLIKSD